MRAWEAWSDIIPAVDMSYFIVSKLQMKGCGRANFLTDSSCKL